MRRAVERSGVNHRVDGRHGEGVVDVLDKWNGYYVQALTIRTLQRAIGAYETGTLPETTPAANTCTTVSPVRRVAERLPRVARALRDRYDKRETLKMDDEYDVQDLLRALLGVDFDDVRKEEGTPRFAGKFARMDLLLKAEQIVIEVKTMKPGRAEKQMAMN